MQGALTFRVTSGPEGASQRVWYFQVMSSELDRVMGGLDMVY